MKKIVIIGSNSDISKSINLDSNFEIIKLSSQKSNFNILKIDTFPVINNIDGLVYFPGTINLKPFKNFKKEDFLDDYNINVIGLINIIQHYQNDLNNNSSLVFISSVAASIGMKYHASISMCKSAIEGLTRSLASEFAPKVRVNCIAPSIIDTKLSSRLLRSDTTRQNIINNHPLKRIGQTKDISNLIEFLLTEKSSWITGQTINVDGGLSNIQI
tara:strand:- start:1036 stop:1680 length:645 start_codon:yes stop_codon:yes gene_type:complete